MSFFKGLKEGMKLFGNSLSTIINSLLLSIVYIIGVGLTSFIAKIFKKHFLKLKLSKQKKTYWSDLDLKKEPIENYYRSF